MSEFSKGDHVEASFGSEDRVIAHYVSGPHEQGGETKHTIQAPDGSDHNLALRSEKDVQADNGRYGGTFRAV